MGVEDEVETYEVGQTDDVTINLVVRDRSDPELSSWTVEITTRGHHGQNSTLVDVSLELPAESARTLAPLLYAAGDLLSELIKGNADDLPDEPPI
jgi:hypothetical protein